MRNPHVADRICDEGSEPYIAPSAGIPPRRKITPRPM